MWCTQAVHCELNGDTLRFNMEVVPLTCVSLHGVLLLLKRLAWVFGIMHCTTAVGAIVWSGATD